MSAGRAAWSAEARQFVRLVRLSFQRFLEVTLGTRDVGAEQFTLWMAALLATPTFFAALVWTSRYPWMRRLSLDRLHEAVLADRLFFVVWPMLVALLVAALIWDGLIPDRTDQQILGVLPVRSRTVAAARLTAAFAVGLALVSAVTVPAAAIYALTSAVHPSVGHVPGIFLGQVTAGVSGGLCVFATLLAARGLLALVIGVARSARAALVVQITAVVLTVESFMFLPGILAAFVRSLLADDALSPVTAVPVAFMGLYAVFAGPHADRLVGHASLAMALVPATLAIAAASYLVPAAWNARRVLEAPLARRTSSPFMAPLLACRRALGQARKRARFAFVLVSLLRSRRHLLTVTTYLGVGVALAGTRVISASIRGRSLDWDAPSAPLLAIPLVLTFFLVLGLRSAFATPTDLGANWVFRAAGPRSVLDTRPAVRLVYVVLSVLPITALAAGAAGWLWGWGAALGVATMHASSGLWLSEVAMRGNQAVPFTCSRFVSSTSMKVGVPLAVGAMLVFAFRLNVVQVWALSSTSRVATYVAVCLTAAVVTALVGRRRVAATDTPYDAPDDAMTTLSLSGATQ